MSLTSIKTENFSNLKGKVVVLSGGATGIGAATVKLLHGVGAKVIIGDVNVKDVDAILSSLNSDKIHFVKADVTIYSDIVALFQKAKELYGRVDVAISNAGLIEVGDMFSDTITKDEITQEPDSKVLDVNLRGTIFFARIAAWYLRESFPKPRNGASTGNHQGGHLVLIGSVASFREFPGLFVYSASKHGVIGVLRATKNVLRTRDGTRVNVISPDMTDTQMVAGVISAYKANNVPVNEPRHVAEAILYAASADINGLNLYVSGGKVYELEESLKSVETQWLGEDLSKNLKAGEQALSKGAEKGWVEGEEGK